MSSSDPDPIDKETFARLEEIEAMGAKGVVSRVLNAYLREGPALVDRIERSVQAGDSTGLVEAAHALISSSASVGALGLGQLCLRAEQFGRKGDLPSASALLGSLRSEFERTRDSLVKRLSDI